MSMTKFHEKNNELDKIKKRALEKLAELNRLRLDYVDWFRRQNQSFVNCLKQVQVAEPMLVPQEINTLQQYRNVVKMAKQLVISNRFSTEKIEKLDKYLGFWTSMTKLKDEIEKQVLPEIKAFESSVTSLREPEVMEEINKLWTKLDKNFSENFNFKNSHNERDNLYTYRLMVSDQRFIGLVNYIPFLLNFATKLCFMVTKIFVEFA